MFRKPLAVTAQVSTGAQVGASRKPCPMKCPVTGRQTIRSASCVAVPDGIACLPSQLRFCRRSVMAQLGPADHPHRTFLFGAAANGVHNPQVAKTHRKPIILQVPNRDSNSAKMIRPVQGTFSGLQHPADSDRFTLSDCDVVHVVRNRVLRPTQTRTPLASTVNGGRLRLPKTSKQALRPPLETSSRAGLCPAPGGRAGLVQWRPLGPATWIPLLQLSIAARLSTARRQST